MLQFLQPQWLWASIGMVVPIAIHLWNNKNGKVVKIGSVAFIQQTAIRKKYSYKITEWLLLLIRCLLIIALTFWLAKPNWQSKESINTTKKWILISSTNASKIYLQFQSTIDSLLKEQYELRLFEPNFTAVSKNNLSQQNIDTLPAVSYWYTLSLLQQQQTGFKQVCIFTEGKLQHFTGEKPNIQSNIKWYIYKDTSIKKQTYIQSAYLNDKDSIVLQIAETNSHVTNYRYKNVANKSDFYNQYLVNAQQFTITDTTSGGKVLIDTAIANIGIYADEWLTDYMYVEAAIAAIKRVTGKRIRIINLFKSKEQNVQFQTVFWLSKRSLPKTIQAKTIVEYSIGESRDTGIWLPTLHTTVYQLLSFSKQASIPLIQNFLSVSNVIPNHYFLHTRLHPHYSNLVWENQFPSWLMQFLSERIIFQNAIHANNLTQISYAEILPNQVVKNKNVSDIITVKYNLESFVWIIIFLLFFVERWYSHQPLKKRMQ